MYNKFKKKINSICFRENNIFFTRSGKGKQRNSTQIESNRMNIACCVRHCSSLSLSFSLSIYVLCCAELKPFNSTQHTTFNSLSLSFIVFC